MDSMLRVACIRTKGLVTRDEYVCVTRKREESLPVEEFEHHEQLLAMDGSSFISPLQEEGYIYISNFCAGYLDFCDEKT